MVAEKHHSRPAFIIISVFPPCPVWRYKSCPAPLQSSLMGGGRRCCHPPVNWCVWRMGLSVCQRSVVLWICWSLFSLHPSALQAMVETVNNLLQPQALNAWRDLNASEQQRAATKLLDTVEDSAFVLADNLLKTDIVRENTDNIRKGQIP